MAKQKIRIRLKAYDHRILDQSAKRIVDTAERSGAKVVGPVMKPNWKILSKHNFSSFSKLLSNATYRQK